VHINRVLFLGNTNEEHGVIYVTLCDSYVPI